MLSAQDVNIPQGPLTQKSCNGRIPFPIVSNRKGNKAFPGSNIASDPACYSLLLAFQARGKESAIIKPLAEYFFLWSLSFEGGVKRQ